MMRAALVSRSTVTQTRTLEGRGGARLGSKETCCKGRTAHSLEGGEPTFPPLTTCHWEDAPTQEFPDFVFIVKPTKGNPFNCGLCQQVKRGSCGNLPQESFANLVATSCALRTK